MRITIYGRVLVLNRANLSHIFKGAFSRFFGSSIIRKIKKKYSNSDKNRQCNSSSSHINRMGGTKSELLNHLARCQRNQILLVAEYIRGTLNVGEDWETNKIQDIGC